MSDEFDNFEEEVELTDMPETGIAVSEIVKKYGFDGTGNWWLGTVMYQEDTMEDEGMQKKVLLFRAHSYMDAGAIAYCYADGCKDITVKNLKETKYIEVHTNNEDFTFYEIEIAYEIDGAKKPKTIREKIIIEEKTTARALKKADEVFKCNSPWKVLKVVETNIDEVLD